MRNMTAAIEFGTSKIICVIGRARSAGRFEVLGAGVAPYEGIRDGRWAAPSDVEEAVAKALDIAEKKVRRRVKEVYVSVPGTFCRVVCENGYVPVKSGVVTVQDIEKLIDDAEDFFVDTKYAIASSTPVYFLQDDENHYIDVVGNRTQSLRGRVSFVLARKQFIKDAEEILRHLGVRVLAFIPEPLAESLFLVPSDERDISAVLINIGCYDTNVTVVYGDAIVYNKTIHAGGVHIASDLSIVLNISVDMAEKIKRRFSFGLETNGSKLYDYVKNEAGRLEKFSHTLVSEVIEARVEHLCQLITGVLEQSPLPIVRRTRIYMSGGGIAMMKGARDILEKQLKRQVRISHVDAPQLSTPNYYTALALLDYVFESHYFGEGDGGKSLLSRLSDKMYE